MWVESSSEIGVEEEGIWATVCLLVLNMVLIDARPRLGLAVGTVEEITSVEDIFVCFLACGVRYRKGGRVRSKTRVQKRRKRRCEKNVFVKVLSGRQSESEKKKRPIGAARSRIVKGETGEGKGRERGGE